MKLPSLQRWTALLGAALGGLGMIFWIASNWANLSRSGRFAILQGFIFLCCTAALLRPAARTPMGVLGFAGIGALFAFFGQTYQTGADTWQLFALWAGLSLPLCWGTRSELLWAAWASVCSMAIVLWTSTYSGHDWRVDSDTLVVNLCAWAAAAALCFGMSRTPGIWAQRIAFLEMVCAITGAALLAISSALPWQTGLGPQFWAGLAVLSAAALVSARPGKVDILQLCAAALALNVLVFAGVLNALGRGGDVLANFLIMGIVGAVLLAITVSVILRILRAQGEPV